MRECFIKGTADTRLSRAPANMRQRGVKADCLPEVPQPGASPDRSILMVLPGQGRHRCAGHPSSASRPEAVRGFLVKQFSLESATSARRTCLVNFDIVQLWNRFCVCFGKALFILKVANKTFQQWRSLLPLLKIIFFFNSAFLIFCFRVVRINKSDMKHNQRSLKNNI